MPNPGGVLHGFGHIAIMAATLSPMTPAVSNPIDASGRERTNSPITSNSWRFRRGRESAMTE
jgi:hypothetical protein